MITSEKQEKITFEGYLIKLKNALPDFRDKMIAELDISIESFYRKLRTNSFKRSEKIVIANYMNSDVETLFPETSTKPIK